MLRVVFFDAAGTLFHTREPAGLSYAKIARRFGVQADERLVIDSFRRAFAAAPGLAFGPGQEATLLRRLEREWWHRLVRSTFAGLGAFTDFDAYFDALFAFLPTRRTGPATATHRCCWRRCARAGLGWA